MLVNEFGIPRERVRIVYNAVDLARIPLRTRKLPNKPERALVFVKQSTSYVEALGEALTARGIATEYIGYAVDRPVPDPLKLIVDYDLVVGAARIAIEGAACGAAVLVADQRGLAGMLTTTNFERFQANNFERAVLTRPVDAKTIGAEVDTYDAIDASTVSLRVRASASLDRQLEQVESLFAEAMQRFKQRPPDTEYARAALASYLARHLPRIGESSPRLECISTAPSINEQIETLKVQIGTLETPSEKLRAQIGTLETQSEELKAQIGTLESQSEELRAQIGTLEARSVMPKAPIGTPEAQSEELKAVIEHFRGALVALRWFAWPLIWTGRRAKSILRRLPRQ